MGGTIGVDNALGRGSVFWFTVQFDKRRVDADDAGFQQKPTKACARWWSTGMPRVRWHCNACWHAGI